MFAYMRRGPNFYKEVAALAAPIILQDMITSTLSMADTFMVGLLGEEPMAAVTLANIPLFVVQLFIFGVQSGSTVLLSQYWGKQDMESINRIYGMALWLVMAVSSLCSVILLICPVEFLSLFGNDRAVVELAAQYGRLAGLSYVFNAFSMTYIAAFRSMEHPQLGMYILATSMAVNTFLNWVFIFGNLGAPALGVQGAALATLIARVLEVVIVACHMARNRIFRVRWRLVLRPGKRLARQFLMCSGPVVLNETLWGLGTSMYPTVMGHMAGSTEILAAYTLAGNGEKICKVVSMGLASTAAIIIGREIGAGHKDRVYGVGLALNTLAAVGGAALGLALWLVLVFLAPTYVFPLFKLSAGAAAAATMMITLQAVIMPLKDFNSVNIVGVLRGGGDVRATTLIDILPLWLVAVPMAAICGLVLKTGIFWVYLSLGVEQFCKCVGGVWRLRSGKWIRDLTRSGALE